jgi:hypothetical protein
MQLLLNTMLLLLATACIAHTTSAVTTGVCTHYTIVLLYMIQSYIAGLTHGATARLVAPRAQHYEPRQSSEDNARYRAAAE